VIGVQLKTPLFAQPGVRARVGEVDDDGQIRLPDLVHAHFWTEIRCCWAHESDFLILLYLVEGRPQHGGNLVRFNLEIAAARAESKVRYGQR
jgi:hypothetical protein